MVVVGRRRRMFHRRKPQTLAWKFGEHGTEHCLLEDLGSFEPGAEIRETDDVT